MAKRWLAEAGSKILQRERSFHRSQPLLPMGTQGPIGPVQEGLSISKTIKMMQSKEATAIGIGVGAVAGVHSYKEGIKDTKRSLNEANVVNNMEMSDDGGGMFLNNRFRPKVSDTYATGELVHALHTLRNGG